MRVHTRIAIATALVTSLATTAPAQVTGSFEGTITGKAGTVPIATVFTQLDRAVTGTVALPGDLATFGGEYLVIGKATPSRIKVSGSGGEGGSLKMNLKVTGGTLRGKMKIKVPGKKLAGTAALTRNVSTGDGSSCDGVYQANQALFDDQVLDQALDVCSTCHAVGLQAESTRLSVDVTDPLATARGVALFVDATDPAASQILTKPLNLVPHGGGVQITPGGSEEQLLLQWVALVAQAQCH